MAQCTKERNENGMRERWKTKRQTLMINSEKEGKREKEG